jgi:peptidoglycan/xylan/chitin deacetylase (PgdA/CDA1 family)
MDGDQLRRRDPRSIDRRTVLKAGLAAAVVGVAGGGLASCTTSGKQGTRAAADSEAAGTSSITAPADAARSATTASSAASPTSNAPASSPVAAQSPSPSTQQTSPAPSQSGSTQGEASDVRSGARAVEITHGPASASGVALTFHGAGDVTLATRLLAELESAGAQATVLAVGQWLDQEPAMAKRILTGGHELGNHTYRHLTMPPLSEVVDESEITRCADVLRRLTGSAGRWFRPSGTVHATPAILEAAGRAGYATSLSYDVDPADYADPGATAVTSRVLAAVRSGSIVSLHLGHLGTVQAIPAILDGLRSRGLAAVTMSDLMG